MGRIRRWTELQACMLGGLDKIHELVKKLEIKRNGQNVSQNLVFKLSMIHGSQCYVSS